jgi:hypothetical protein
MVVANLDADRSVPPRASAVGEQSVITLTGGVRPWECRVSRSREESVVVRGRLLLVVAALLVSAGCVGATPEPTSGPGRGPLQFRVAEGGNGTYRPVDAGRLWTANVAFPVCVDGGRKAVVRSLQVNGRTVGTGGPVTGYLHRGSDERIGFLTAVGEPSTVAAEYGGTWSPIRGARLSAPCDVLTPLSLVLSIEVPREGYVVRSFGFTYEVGGTTYRTTKRGWTYAACGTAPQELCSGQP